MQKYINESTKKQTEESTKKSLIDDLVFKMYCSKNTSRVFGAYLLRKL